MPGDGSARTPQFSVYQNPSFSAALTTSSLRRSAAVSLIISSFLFVSVAALLTLLSREGWISSLLTQFNVFMIATDSFTMSLRVLVGLLFIFALLALVRVLSLQGASFFTVKQKDQLKGLTDRQLNLLGQKPKTPDKDSETIKKPKVSRFMPSEPIVLVRKSPFSPSPAPSQIGYNQTSSGGKKMVISSASSMSSLSPHYQEAGSHSPMWSKGSAKGIQSEEILEKFLADLDEKLNESTLKEASQTTPPPTIRGIGITSPRSFTSSTTPSGASISAPLRPVRMSPGSHQKYPTPPKKGEGEFPPPMPVQQLMEGFENLCIYPQIELWRDRLRQWFSSVLINPLLHKIETSYILVMSTASNLGISINVSPVGSDLSQSAFPVAISPAGKEWQPTFTLDEDGILHQLCATLQQAHLRSTSQIPTQGTQPAQQNRLLSQIQACMDAITEHQKLSMLMKGELIKGLLPQSSVRVDYMVQRVRELAEGTCLKNYDYVGNGNSYNNAGNKADVGELPTDSHLLLYLFCAFLEYPKWILHIDPTSYSDYQSSKTPLFLGVLPPKDRFPDNYVAVVSGVPSVIHPGASVLAVGKQRPPICALYWDKKLQFSMQGRTAIWDAILLLCHSIKVAHGGTVRGVHLNSPALDILSVIDPDPEV